MRNERCPGWTERRRRVAPLCAVTALLLLVPAALAQQPRSDNAEPTQPPVVPRLPVESLRGLFSALVPAELPAEQSATRQIHVPIQRSPTHDNIDLRVDGERVTLIVRDAQLQDVLTALADSQGVNIACATNSNIPVTLTLRNEPIERALDAVASIVGCTWTRQGDIIYVTDVDTGKTLPPDVQGKVVQVFPLDFIAGSDVAEAIKPWLSPVGNAYATAVQENDNRRTRESIVVEDLPVNLTRIAQYIDQVDQPPRQVMIEVHVLQVDLEKDCRHGVNFTHLMNFAGNTLQLQMTGFANPSAPQAFFAQLSASNLFGLIEALKNTTDAKTLASPKVLALNGQLSRIQIGEKLGYRVLSNTQTATLESVEFLDVGVVLEVTPVISRDNQVMMKINPKVSSGQVVEETGLPNEKTSEVMTNVLLRDGQGIVIGGLIQEDEFDNVSKLMFLGDLYLIGALFQRRVTTKVRKEVIFFLVPRIVPCCATCDPAEEIDRQRVLTRLYHGPLHDNYRPYDPRFPSCYDRPKEHPWIQRMHDHVFQPEGDCGYQLPSAWPAEQIAPGTVVPPIMQVQPLEGPAQQGQPDDVPREEGDHMHRTVPQPSSTVNPELPDPDNILRDTRNAPRPLIFRGLPERRERPVIARLPTIDSDTTQVR